MKQTKEFRGQGHRPEATMKKAVKLAPLKKSGKERHMIYSSLDDKDTDPELTSYGKKESVLDYFDDEGEDI